jgi:hypothetical protein
VFWFALTFCFVVAVFRFTLVVVCEDNGADVARITANGNIVSVFIKSPSNMQS